MSFLREVFSEDGQGSFSRCAAGFHTVAGLTWVSQFTWWHHAIPDGVTLAALAAFITAPYAANKAAAAVSSFGNPKQ